MGKGQLSLRGRPEENLTRPGEPAWVVQPPGRDVESLVHPSRYAADAAQLLRPQSRREGASGARGFVGARYAAAAPVFRERGPRKSRPARFRTLQCQLGPLSNGQ